MRIAADCYRLTVCKRENSELIKEGIRDDYSALSIPHPISAEEFCATSDCEICEIGRITLKANKWNRLPSLSTCEQLAALSLNDSSVSYELAHDSDTNFYFIKPLIQDKETVECTFVLDLTKAVSQENPHIFTPFHQFPPVSEDDIKALDKTLSLENYIDKFLNTLIALSLAAHTANGSSQEEEIVRLLAAFFNTFTPKDTKSLTYSSRDDVLLKLMQLKTGACGNRAEMFLMLAEILQRKYAINIKVRLVDNDVHDNIEFFINERWLRIDLGGYPAKLKPIDSVAQTEQSKPKPLLTPKQQQQYEDAAVLKQFRMIQKIEHCNLPELLKSVTYCASNVKGKNKFALFTNTNEERDSLFLDVIQHFGRGCYPIWNISQLDPEDDCVFDEQGNKKNVRGALEQFLTHTNPPVLVINLDNFSPRERLRIQSLLDNEAPKIGSLQIPKNTLIIFVSSDKTKAENDASFSERISQKIVVDNIPAHSAPIVIGPGDESVIIPEPSSALFVPMYNQSDFETILMGELIPANGKYQYKPGPLALCCESGSHNKLVLINPPDPSSPCGIELIRFIEVIKREGRVYYNGSFHDLPAGFEVIYQSIPYSFEKQEVKVIASDKLPNKEYYLINQSSFGNLFSNAPFAKDGWIAKSPDGAKKTITLLITEQLDKCQWAKLLDYAKANNCILQLYSYPEIPFPQEFEKAIVNSGSDRELTDLSCGVIVTENVEHTLQMKKTSVKTTPAIWDFPIDQYTTYTQLMQNPIISDDHISMNSLPLLAALERGETVILHGKQISHDLYRDLELMLKKRKYLKNGKEVAFTGKLILITTAHEFINVNGIPPIIPSVKPALAQATTTATTAATTIASPQILPTATVTAEPISAPTATTTTTESSTAATTTTVVTTIASPQILPTATAVSPTPTAVSISTGAPKEQPTDRQKAIAFEQQRKEQIRRAMLNNPILALSGSTKAGKTYFTHSVLPFINEGCTIKTHESFDNLQKWVNEGGTLILDINKLQDPSELSILRGIYGHPPIIGEKLLTKSHNVVLVFDPKEMESAKEVLGFMTECNIPVIDFPDLPDCYLKDQVLGNVWRALGAPISPELHSIAIKANEDLFNLYKMAENSGEITPRNLQQMLLNFIALQNKQSSDITGDKLSSLILYAADLEMRHHLSKDNYLKWQKNLSKEQLRLIKEFSEEKEKELAKIGAALEKIYCGKCYYPILEALEMQWDIAELRKEFPALCAFGMYGINITGEPGAGKSRLVKRYFRYKKLKSETKWLRETRTVSPTSMPELSVKKDTMFIQFNPSDPEEFFKIMDSAFHHGEKVNLDEGNSLPQEFIKCYLSGRDRYGNLPKEPGFTLTNTGNSAAIDGRTGFSLSLLSLVSNVEQRLDEESIRKILELKKVGHNGCALYVMPKALFESSKKTGFKLYNNSYILVTSDDGKAQVYYVNSNAKLRDCKCKAELNALLPADWHFKSNAMGINHYSLDVEQRKQVEKNITAHAGHIPPNEIDKLIRIYFNYSISPRELWCMAEQFTPEETSEEAIQTLIDALKTGSININAIAMLMPKNFMKLCEKAQTNKPLRLLLASCLKNKNAKGIFAFYLLWDYDITEHKTNYEHIITLINDNPEDFSELFAAMLKEDPSYNFLNFTSRNIPNILPQLLLLAKNDFALRQALAEVSVNTSFTLWKGNNLSCIFKLANDYPEDFFKSFARLLKISPDPTEFLNYISKNMPSVLPYLLTTDFLTYISQNMPKVLSHLLTLAENNQKLRQALATLSVNTRFTLWQGDNRSCIFKLANDNPEDFSKSFAQFLKNITNPTAFLNYISKNMPNVLPYLLTLAENDFELRQALAEFSVNTNFGLWKESDLIHIIRLANDNPEDFSKSFAQFLKKITNPTAFLTYISQNMPNVLPYLLTLAERDQPLRQALATVSVNTSFNLWQGDNRSCIFKLANDYPEDFLTPFAQFLKNLTNPTAFLTDISKNMPNVLPYLLTLAEKDQALKQVLAAYQSLTVTPEGCCYTFFIPAIPAVTTTPQSTSTSQQPIASQVPHSAGN